MNRADRTGKQYRTPNSSSPISKPLVVVHSSSKLGIPCRLKVLSEGSSTIPRICFKFGNCSRTS
uniref:Uncharacterized protein n=1 Tax=Arundo donax TaxID=35708 RepID=A0A0A8YJV6_ARUDO